MMLTAQEVYQSHVRNLSLPERFRLAALLLDELQTLPALPPADTLTQPVTQPRPVFGSGKNDISYMADDFDAPPEDMREYME